MNFDWFYLFGCALMGWSLGARGALVLVIISSAFLFYHDAFLAAPHSHYGLPVGIQLFACWRTAQSQHWPARRAGLHATWNNTSMSRPRAWKPKVRQHKQTADLLNEAVELFQQVTENITDVFWVTDATKSRVEYISPGFERIWGKARRELYDSPGVWLEGIHPDDRQRVMRGMFSRQTRVTMTRNTASCVRIRPSAGCMIAHFRSRMATAQFIEL